MRLPSKLASGADVYCFKEKIEPKWEDPVCANGGNWTMSFPRGKSDTCWLYTVCIVVYPFAQCVIFYLHSDSLFWFWLVVGHDR